MSDTLIGTWAGDVNPETKADILHSEVTSAIYRADELGVELVNAWLEVAEVERKLANLLPDGPEKRIAVRGVERAEQQANKIKELTAR